jgi:hypothetical protein
VANVYDTTIIKYFVFSYSSTDADLVVSRLCGTPFETYQKEMSNVHEEDEMIWSCKLENLRFS